MSTVAQALTFRWPDKKWATHGPNYTDIEWLDADPKPTEAEVEQARLDLDAQPPPPDPDAELDAALTALKGTGATVDDLIDAMMGKTGKRGRVAGRPV